MARERSVFATKSVEELVAENERAGLRRSLGWFSLTGIGIAGIIGAGIFVFLGEVARDVAGPIVLVSIVLGAVTAILVALAFAEFAALVPSSGSAYVYAFATLGRFPAFLMGWFILNSYAVGNMVVAASWTRFFVSGLATLGIGFPPQLAASPAEGGILNLPAALLVVLVTILILPRVRESTLVNNILVVFKLFVVLFIVAFGVFLIDTANYTPFNPYAEPGLLGETTPILVGAALLLFAYLGFDAVAAAAGEARRPQRDLPIGIVLSVAIAAILYIGMALVVTGMQPYHELSDGAPLADGFTAAGYSWAAGIVTLGALVALATVVFAFQLGVTRIVYAMAHDGFVPRFFDRVNPRTGTPWRITILLGAFVVLGAAFVPRIDALEMTVLSAIAMYTVVCIGVLVLKAKRPDLPRRFSAPWPIPVLGIAAMLAFAAWGFTTTMHLLFIAWIGLGLLVYGFYGHRKSLERDEERDSTLEAEQRAVAADATPAGPRPPRRRR